MPWTEHRLLVVIGALTAVVAGYELTHPPTESPSEREQRSANTLAEVYPEDPRQLYARGMRSVISGDHEAALSAFSLAFDAGFREQEKFFAAYIDVLVTTDHDVERIRQVADRWQSAYPASQRWQRTKRRLEEARLLP